MRFVFTHSWSVKLQGSEAAPRGPRQSILCARFLYRMNAALWHWGFVVAFFLFSFFCLSQTSNLCVMPPSRSVCVTQTVKILVIVFWDIVWIQSQTFFFFFLFFFLQFSIFKQSCRTICGTRFEVKSVRHTWKSKNSAKARKALHMYPLPISHMLWSFPLLFISFTSLHTWWVYFLFFIFFPHYMHLHLITCWMIVNCCTLSTFVSHINESDFWCLAQQQLTIHSPLWRGSRSYS